MIDRFGYGSNAIVGLFLFAFVYSPGEGPVPFVGRPAYLQDL